jgi:hypothetical protein
MREKAAPAAGVVAALIGDNAEDGAVDQYAIEVMARVGEDVAIPALERAAAKGNQRAKIVAELLEKRKYEDFDYRQQAIQRGLHELERVLEILYYARRDP